MLSIPESNVIPVITLLVFISAVLLFEGVYLIWRSRRGKEAVRVQQRLERLTRARAAEAQRTVLKERKLSALSSLERLMRSMAPALRLEQRIIQSGLRWTVARLLLSSAAAAVVGSAVAAVTTRSAYIVLLTGALLGMLPWAYLTRARHKRMKRLEQQLPDALLLF